MDSADQVILVLQIVLTMGPIAVYFLTLGLFSSQAYPRLVSERSDFVLLGLAFVPVICWPLVSLVTTGRFVLAGVLLTAIVLVFVMLLPGRQSGWVIYNISSQECRRALRRACARLGWQMEYTTGGSGEETEAQIRPAGFTIGFSAMPWLRNMTLRIKPAGNQPSLEARDALLATLDRELRKESMLPSAAGAGLVVIGATLLGLPMWYLFSNMNAIVDVVRRMLLA